MATAPATSKPKPKPKKSAPKSAVHLSAESRQLKKPAYQSFKLSKRIKGEVLPGAFGLFRSAARILLANWKVFLGIVAVYGLLNALLVHSFSNSGDLSNLKSTLDQFFGGGWSKLAGGAATFAYLVGSSGNTSSPTAGVYQVLLLILVSLALIWTLRQVHAGHTVRIRDGFYHGMYPLVQFGLVVLAVLVQLVPMAIGLALYTTVTSNNIAVTPLEQVLWGLLAFVLSVLSLYMISSSLFALYIVTLPDMTPFKALRSARQLVANRRWSVLRKILFLPLALILLAAVIMVPLIMFATPVAAWVFFLLIILLFPFAHSYMYALYRALI